MNVYDIMMLTGAAGLALLMWRLLNPPRRLVITDRGILDRGLRLGWIQWDEIEGAYQPRVGDQDRLRLKLRISDRLSRRLRRRFRRGGVPELMEVNLNLVGSSLSVVEILQRILAHDRPVEAPADACGS